MWGGGGRFGVWSGVGWEVWGGGGRSGVGEGGEVWEV